MYQVINGSENGNVGIKIEKKLTQDDYQLLIPYIDRLNPKAGRVSLLCDISECEEPTSQTLWSDLVDRLRQLYEIPRVAVIACDRQKTISNTKAVYPLHHTTVKYFTPAQHDKAWHWVEKHTTEKI